MVFCKRHRRLGYKASSGRKRSKREEQQRPSAVSVEASSGT
jgi:hypothetical protein